MLVVFSVASRAGGGEVSGGGTLYMKWGAGHLGSTRVLKARADRVTAHNFLFSLFFITHLFSPLTLTNNFIFILSKITQKKA
jgi:hypothetical protein